MAARMVRVRGLSPKATEQDIYDFFSFSGDIENINVQSENGARVAFVIFKDSGATDTAILLSGATIVDQIVSIEEVDSYFGDCNENKQHANKSSTVVIGGAVNRAQDVISTMLSKGYDLGKDAMVKAKAFDEKHHLSTNATSTVSSLDQKIGLSQKLGVVNEQVKAFDEKFHISEKTQSAFKVAEQTVNGAGSALLKNKYIFMGASWASGAFNKVTKTAGEVGQKALNRVQTSHVKDDSQQHIAMVNINSS